MELKFNRSLSGSDINKFTLNQKGLYRDIYEFKGVWSPGTVESIKGFLVDEVHISQFNAQTVRVVFANKFEINLRLRAEDKSNPENLLLRNGVATIVFYPALLLFANTPGKNSFPREPDCGRSVYRACARRSYAL